MKKLLIVFSLLSLIFLFTVNTFAATTNVTATLQDPSAQVLAGATVTALFRPVPGLSGPYTTTGGASFNQSTTPVLANGAGVISITLTDNLTIIPVGSKWTFTICPKASVAACYQTSVSITGASQDISAQLNAAVTAITVFGSPLPFVYNTNEVVLPSNAGTSVWDVIANTVKFWNGSIWLAPIANPTSLFSITDPYIDIRALGAVCDWNGSSGTDDSAALVSALANGTLGATILIPGRCSFASKNIVLTNNGVKIIGIGVSTLGGNVANRSEMVFTATGIASDDLLRSNNSYGAYTFRDLVIKAQSCSYAGKMLNLRSAGGAANPTNITIDNILVRGNETCGVNTFAPDVGINLHGVIHTVIRNSEVQFVQRGINGCDTASGNCSAAIEISDFLCYQNHQCITNAGQGWKVDPLRVEGTGSDMQIYKETNSGQLTNNLYIHCTYCGDWVSTTAPLIQFTSKVSNFVFKGAILQHSFNTSEICIQFGTGYANIILDGASFGCPIDLGTGTGANKAYNLSAINTFIQSNVAGGPFINLANGLNGLKYQSASSKLTSLGTETHRGLDSGDFSGNTTFGGMTFRSAIGQLFLAGTSRFQAVPVPDGTGVNWLTAGSGAVAGACAGGVTGTNYTYFVWAKDRNGFRSYPARQVGPISCAAVLDATHYVKLFVSTPDDGVVGYDVTKTDQVTKLGTGVFFDEDNIDCFGFNMCFYDKGASTSAYVPPTHAESADVTIDGWLNGAPITIRLSNTDTVDLASVATGACTAERTVTITGAAFGNGILVSAGTALEAGGLFTAKVTLANTVKWQFCNLSGGAIDRASDTYTLQVIQ